MTNSLRFCAPLAVAVFSLAACAGKDEGGTRSTGAVVVSPDSVPQASIATRRLVAFLEASMVGRYAHNAVFDTLVACEAENSADPVFALGSYRVLRSRVFLDTVVTTVAVLTVAEETNDQTGAARIATQRTRVDTLSWSLVRNHGGKWGVCGRSREGFEFSSFSEKRARMWRPRGSSRASMIATADSIRSMGMEP